ncbi:MAG: acyl carrier protein [Chloroflexi bacterium]|nr:acyl carrier protein [Chloroflexota bacterium]
MAVFVQQQLAWSLQQPVDQMDSERPLTSFGVDSLLAIELKTTLEDNLDIDLPLTTLLESPYHSGTKPTACHLAKHLNRNQQSRYPSSRQSASTVPAISWAASHLVSVSTRARESRIQHCSRLANPRRYRS